MPTVLTDEALRAAIIHAAQEQVPRCGRPQHPGKWTPKPPVLPCIPLRARRVPRMQSPGSGRPRGSRVGAQLNLFDPKS